MDSTERYLRSLEKNVRKIKGTVRGILAFFTFVFVIMIIAGVYIYVKKDDIIKEYYEEYQKEVQEAVDELSETIKKSQDEDD